jgi:transposase
LTKNEIKNKIENKMNKVFYLLANKYTLRKIENIVHIDRTDISNSYKNSNIKISYEYADKIAKYVRQYKPSVDKIKEKFGKKGLSALIEYKIIAEKRDEEILSNKVKKMREEEGISFIKIGKKLNLCANTIHRLYIVSKRNKGNVNNILFEKCNERDKNILEDYKKNNMTTKQLSQKYNLSTTRIRHILNNKFDIVYKRRKISNEDIKRIVELRDKYKLTWPSIDYIFNMNQGGAEYYYADYYIQKRRTE